MIKSWSTFLIWITLTFLWQASFSQFKWIAPIQNANNIYKLNDGHLILQTTDDEILSFNGIQFSTLTSNCKVLSFKDNVALVLKNDELHSTTDFIRYQAIDFNISGIECKTLFSRSDTFYLSTPSSYEIHQFSLSENQVYKYFENDIHPIRLKSEQNTRLFLMINNLLFDATRPYRPIHAFKDPIIDITSKNNQIIAATKEKIYASENDRWFQLSSLVDAFPKDIIAIQQHKEKTYILSDNDLFVFDWRDSSIDRLGEINGQFRDWVIDDWQQLWIVSDIGMQKISLTKSHFPSSLKVKSIIDNNGKIYDTNKVVLNKPIKYLDITYSALNLSSSRKTEVSYLLNADKWKTTQSNPFRIDYEELDNQNLNLSIRASSEGKNISVPINISVEKIYHENKIGFVWRILFGVLGALLMISLLSLYNLNNRKEKMNLEFSKLRTENSLLQMKQQFHELQIRPHFIFNALNSIQGLVSTNQNIEAKQSIVLVSRFLRNFLYQSEVKTNNIENEIQLLSDYMDLEKLCRNHSFDFVFNIPDILKEEEIPNMIIQPIIENAIVHGFQGIKHKGLIEITFSEYAEYIMCVVKDNGKGFNSNAPKDTNHKSMAMKLIEERLGLLDKNRRSRYIETESSQSGTTVKLYFK